MGLPGKAEITATTGPGLHVKHLNLTGISEVTIKLNKQVLEVVDGSGTYSTYDLADAGTVSITPANKMLTFSVKQENVPHTAEQQHIDDDHAKSDADAERDQHIQETLKGNEVKPHPDNPPLNSPSNKPFAPDKGKK